MLGSKEKADYLAKMLAYRYQTHEVKVKPHVCFYFYGLVGGYGKSLFASNVEKVFDNIAVMSVMDQTALDSMSAIDMWTRTWVIVQEVDVKKGSTNYNKIKTMTGGDSFAAMTAFASSLLMSHIICGNKSEDRKINQLINFKDT
jgi:hypothetical protein